MNNRKNKRTTTTKKKKIPVVSLGIFSAATDGTMCPGVHSASKNEYQDFSWGKGGQVPNVKKIRGLNLPGTPWATSACCGRPLPYLYNPLSFPARRPVLVCLFVKIKAKPCLEMLGTTRLTIQKRTCQDYNLQ
jgi:hypothetical protein